MVGWERFPGPRGPHHFPVRRAPARFLARTTATSVLVTTAEQVPIATYVLDVDTFTTLERNGWLVTHADDDDDGPGLLLPVLPLDWPHVVRFVSHARSLAHAAVEQADLGWRYVVREGLLAGQDAGHLARLTGVSPPGIHEVAEMRSEGGRRRPSAAEERRPDE